MSQFIFNPLAQTDSEQYYCLKGCESFIDDQGMPRSTEKNSPNTVAYCVQNKKSKNIIADKKYFTYYIKIAPDNTIFNPLSTLSRIKSKRQYDYIEDVCKQQWAFKEVTKITFDKYITFLSTHNVAWLKDAERELK